MAFRESGSHGLTAIDFRIGWYNISTAEHWFIFLWKGLEKVIRFVESVMDGMD